MKLIMGRKLRKLFLLFAIVSVVVACGGGIDGTGIKDPSVEITSSGTVEGFGSVIVNGVRYETEDTKFYIDGVLGSQDDLAIGHTVLVTGQIDRDGTTGKADEIRFNTNILGPVEEINVEAARLIILGQVVVVDNSTIFGEGLSLNTIQTTSILQISGFINSEGALLATRIDAVGVQATFEISAVISGINEQTKRFVMNNLTVDYSGATLNTILANGMTVEVKGNTLGNEGELIVDEVNAAETFSTKAGQQLQLEGVVTRFASSMDFDLNGFSVLTDGETIYTDGTSQDITLNVKLEIKGEVNLEGKLVAEKIQFIRTGSFRLVGQLPGEATADQNFLAIRDGNDESKILAIIRLNELTSYIDNSSTASNSFGIEDINFGQDYIEIEGFAEGGNNNTFAASKITRRDLPPEPTFIVEGIVRNLGSAGAPDCSDGIDNDLDGLVDFPEDAGCISAADTDESTQVDGFPAPLASYSYENIDWGAQVVEVVDDSINGLNGTPIGMSSNSSVVRTDDIAGSVLEFSAEESNSNYVDLGKFDVIGSALTLVTWAKFDDFTPCAISNYCYLVSKAASDELEDWYWGIRTRQFTPDGNVFIAFFLATDATTNELVAAEYPISAGQWYHIAARYDGSTMTVFLNGEPVAEWAKTGAIEINADVSVNLSNPSDRGAGFLDGALDNTVIYDSALSDRQIAILAGLETDAEACSDGEDNDLDGLIDFPEDPGCESEQDDDEYNSLGIDTSFTILDYQIIVSDIDGATNLFDKNGNMISEQEFVEIAEKKHVRAEVDSPSSLSTPIKADRIIIQE